MSRFRLSRIIFIFSTLLSVVLYALEYLPAICCFLPAFIYLPLLVWGSANIASQFYLSTKCKQKASKGILLTFDDGPHPEFTPQILQILEKYEQKAIFFCVGKNIKKHPEIARKIIKKGHQIGNHSYSHSHFFALFSTKKVTRELQNTNALIEEISQKPNTLFRPPHGVTNPFIARAVKLMNMNVLGWSVRTFDTSSDSEKVLKKMKKSTPGDIILLHDTQKNTPQIVQQYLQELFDKKKYET